MTALPKIGLRFPAWATQNTQIINGVVRYCRERDCIWQLDADLDSGGELPPNEIDENWRGDGLIVFRCTENEAAQWKRHSIPVINVSSETSIAGITNILPNNYQMGCIAAEYLISIGLTQFAYFGESSRKYSSLRGRGFKQTLENRGMQCIEIDLPISEIHQFEKWQELHALITEQLGDLPLPIGLLARDDIVAMNILRSTRKLNIEVPQQLALVGINDSQPFCLISQPQLTSVRHPAELVGYLAAQTLHKFFEDRHYQAEDILVDSPGIVTRESSNTVPTSDPVVAAGLLYIRKYAISQAVTIAELCKHLNVSSTTLRLRFKNALGSTPKQQIDKVRIQQIQKLLENPQLNIQEIASQADFLSPEELTRFFTRHKGVSPTQYRIKMRS